MYKHIKYNFNPFRNEKIKSNLQTSLLIKEQIYANIFFYIRRIFGYTSLTLGVMGYLYFKKPISLYVSKVAGKVCDITIPVQLREKIYSLYMKIYNIPLDEIKEKDLNKYNTINEFFIREIDMELRKPDSKGVIVSPSDGKILSVSDINDLNQILIVKDTPYKLTEFLFGNFMLSNLSKYFIDNIFKDEEEKERLVQVTIYLSPADCHRYFSPCDLQVEDRVYIPGALYPVKPSYVYKHPNTFFDNERVTLNCTQLSNNFKKLMIVYVGALNVGSIYLNYENFSNSKHSKTQEYENYTNNFDGDDFKNIIKDNNAFTIFDKKEFDFENKNKLETPKEKTKKRNISYNKSNEMGYFRFGSTIVLVFPVGKDEKLSENIVAGNVIKIGNSILEKI